MTLFFVIVIKEMRYIWYSCNTRTSLYHTSVQYNSLRVYIDFINQNNMVTDR